MITGTIVSIHDRDYAMHTTCGNDLVQEIKSSGYCIPVSVKEKQLPEDFSCEAPKCLEQ